MTHQTVWTRGDVSELDLTECVGVEDVCWMNLVSVDVAERNITMILENTEQHCFQHQIPF